MELVKKLKGKKGTFIIGVLILFGVLLLMFPSSEDKESTDTGSENFAEISTYTEKLEEKIRSLCTSVNGAGRVTVLVTLECGSEFVYADNRTEEMKQDFSSYSSDYLIIEDKNGSSPVTVTEIYPRIRGVAVVCDGGDEPTVREKLTKLLSAALGVSAGRISVTS